MENAAEKFDRDDPNIEEAVIVPPTEQNLAEENPDLRLIEKEEIKEEKPEAKPAEAEKEFDLPPREQVFPFMLSGKGWGEKIKDVFSPDKKPVGAEEGGKILEQALNKTFQENKEKLGGVNIDAKGFLEKFDKKKLFGQKARNFLGGMAVGAAVRYSVKWSTGLMGGPLVGATSGAIAGGTWEGVKAYRGESKKHREIFEKKDELYKKAAEIGYEKNINLFGKLDEYHRLLEIEKEVGMVEGKNELYAEIRNGLGLTEERRKITKRGSIKGAILGGLGGFVGGILGDYISGPDEAKAGAHEAKKAIGKEAFEQIKEQTSDVYSKTYENVVTEGLASLDSKDFKITAESGDGATQVARKMLKNLIAERMALGDLFEYSDAELTVAEDLLKNDILSQLDGQTMKPDDVFTCEGGTVRSTLDRALSFSALAKENVQNDWVSKISEDALADRRNYGVGIEEVNNFSEEILEEAERKAEAAISVNDVTEGIGADAAQRMYDFGRDKIASRSIRQAASQYFENIFSTIGAYSAVEYGGIVEKFVNRKKKTVEEAQPEDHDKWSKIGDVSDEYVGDFGEEDIKQEEPEKGAEKTEPKVKEIKEIKKEEPKDPLYEYLEGVGAKLGKGRLKYVVETPLGNKKFSSYGKFSEWFEGLTEKNKEWLRDLERDKYSRAVSISLPKILREYFDSRPKAKARFNEEAERVVKKLFNDKDMINDDVVPEIEHESRLPKDAGRATEKIVDVAVRDWTKDKEANNLEQKDAA